MRRLDAALVAAGLARSRTRAQELIVAGHVTVNGVVVTKSSFLIEGQALAVTESDHYVSRAAYKLLGALETSGTTVYGRALDIGASTGGFTQVLLERGCTRVYAVDVGHGQLAPQVRADARVVVRENLHARNLTLADVDGDPVDVLVIDVSFISLTNLWAPILACLRDDGVAVALVKPQFEVGKGNLGSGGIVRDAEIRAQAIDAALAAAAPLGWEVTWRADSVLPGQSGNVEHVAVLRRAPRTLRGYEGPTSLNL